MFFRIVLYICNSISFIKMECNYESYHINILMQTYTTVEISYDAYKHAYNHFLKKKIHIKNEKKLFTSSFSHLHTFTTTSIDISMHSHFVLHFLLCLSKINIPLPSTLLPSPFIRWIEKLFTRTKSITNTKYLAPRPIIIIILGNSPSRFILANEITRDEIIFCPQSKINIHLSTPMLASYPLIPFASFFSFARNLLLVETNCSITLAGKIPSSMYYNNPRNKRLWASLTRHGERNGGRAKFWSEISGKARVGRFCSSVRRN